MNNVYFYCKNNPTKAIRIRKNQVLTSDTSTRHHFSLLSPSSSCSFSFHYLFFLLLPNFLFSSSFFLSHFSRSAYCVNFSNPFLLSPLFFHLPPSLTPLPLSLLFLVLPLLIIVLPSAFNKLVISYIAYLSPQFAPLRLTPSPTICTVFLLCSTLL